ncbi:alpha-amylase family glycosyl hydrolase [Actinoplanes sp. DH11]|uniref:alpha-amylase family glycosyl hydrolase n=1 Tax=Actinoplanes sp. DH11 TaxID=2857011 RepID=UPI001E2E4D72|nr:alpha-amylase family glycosyl hydrolase [Actinoplanes sp. DH11]
MSGWPAAPVVYEIDTWPWLTGVSRRLGRPVTLADVPAAIWDEVAAPGLDAVWLMGVWERSPAGLELAHANENLGRAFRDALPDLQPEDVVGSPYCVRRYRVDERLGGPEGLAAARAELRRRGLRLVLDYVPNHTAPDHPGTVEHPEWYIQGTPEDLAADPAGWFTTGGRVIAHGRDPFFPPWPDVAQLNAFAPGLREATASALIGIGEQCDGVRCDMAMLFTNDIFARTWGRYAGPAPDTEFWPEIFAAVRAAHPDLVMIAEAYWDMEWTLQQQGFDFCYDKRLYDRLAHEDADAVRKHLAAGRDYQDRLIRFLENHDEPRAAATMPGGRDRAAAIAVATLPGAVLWHDGQFDGRRAQLPVFLARYRDEPADLGLREFYHRLLALAAPLRRGEWRMLDCLGWPDNPTHRDVLAWAWYDGDVPRHVVVINFGAHASQGRVELPWPALAGRAWRLTNLLDGRVFERDGADLVGNGLFVDLPAWGAHVITVQ